MQKDEEVGELAHGGRSSAGRALQLLGPRSCELAQNVLAGRCRGARDGVNSPWESLLQRAVELNAMYPVSRSPAGDSDEKSSQEKERRVVK